MSTEADKLARRRQQTHDNAGNNSRRFFKDRNHENRIGAAGELAFEKLTGFKADRTKRKDGDGGIDFETPIGRIDVKCAVQPKYLLVKAKQIGRADFYVLGRYFDDGSVRFLGWATAKEMKLRPKRDFGYKIVSHFKPAEELHPMSDLLDLLKGFGSGNSNKEKSSPVVG